MVKNKLSKLVVVHIAEDISEISGGVPAVVRQLSVHLLSSDIEVVIIHVHGDATNLPSNIRTHKLSPHRLGAAWSFSREFAPKLQEIISAYRKNKVVLHIHGAWSAPQYLAARIAHKAGIPFIFTAHGMLEPWLWHSQGILVAVKKRMYWRHIASAVLSKASVVHAITNIEQNNLRSLFSNKRIEVIPNAIECSTDDEEHVNSAGREKIILFLGRIEPKKGVDLLLRAFASSNLDKDWAVVILGPFWSNKYKTELENIVSEAHMQDRVLFLGPVFGKNKIQWLKKAWVMAVPSHSEAIGLVNLEAAAYQLPTVTTFQTGLLDWEEGGGLLTHPDVEPLRVALETACTWSPEERDRRGLLSQMLMRDRYSWNAILPRWVSLYESVLM